MNAKTLLAWKGSTSHRLQNYLACRCCRLPFYKKKKKNIHSTQRLRLIQAFECHMPKFVDMPVGVLKKPRKIAGVLAVHNRPARVYFQVVDKSGRGKLVALSFPPILEKLVREIGAKLSSLMNLWIMGSVTLNTRYCCRRRSHWVKDVLALR